MTARTIWKAAAPAVLVLGALTACSATQTTVTFSPTDGLSVTTPPGTTPPAAQPTVPAGRVLLDYSHTGGAVTPSYTAGGDGDYTVTWTFTGNTDPDGTGMEFGINEDNSNPASFSDGNLPGPQMDASGSGSVSIAQDQGTHDFSVGAPPGCKWTIKVVTAP